MVDLRIKAKVWVFGNDIDTDQIVPGQYLTSPVEEQSEHAFEAISWPGRTSAAGRAGSPRPRC
jgi:3-isopropylmalate dehydratase small subunit